MPAKQISFHLKGMQRDLSVSKFNPEYAYENMNLRFTVDKDNTLLSIVNEKGTSIVDLLDSDGQPVSIEGQYLGYNSLNNIITIFTKSDLDNIYRLIYNYEDQAFVATLLYSGNLGFDVEYPIETLGIYENEEIQKVYWLDGLNQPRFINVAPSVDNSLFTDNSFDFAQSLKLNESVQVEKNVGDTGIFAPGTIQYAFSYFNSYGQESSIFYTTPLNYVSHHDRGGSPEESISNSFTINMSGLDDSFEYVRVYSIHRTTLNATPVVKKVADIALEEATELIEGFKSFGSLYIFNTQQINNVLLYKDKSLNSISSYPYEQTSDQITGDIIRTWRFDLGPDDRILNINSEPSVSVSLEVGRDAIVMMRIQSSGTRTIMVSSNDGGVYASPYETVYSGTKNVVFTDNGTTGEDVDPSELLFKGSEVITASTMAQKDNTLFLGNIKLLRDKIPSDIKQSLKTLQIQFDNDLHGRNVPMPSPGGIYPYVNQLYRDSSQIKGFKYLDWYRMGVQFQHKTGRWSESVYIKDLKNDKPVNTDGSLVNAKLPSAVLGIDDPSVISNLVDLGYVRARPIIVYPSFSDREVVAQGLLMPTVYNVSDRSQNSPFSMSSWFARPNSPFDYTRSSENDTPLDTSGRVYSRRDFLEDSGRLEGSSLIEHRHNYQIGSNKSRRGEIQAVGDGPPTAPYVTWGAKDEFIDSYSEMFYVDQSILTFHSPEIEFDDSLAGMGHGDLKMRIIGVSPITGTSSDLNIISDTPTYKPGAVGVYDKSPQVLNISRIGARGLSAGLNYMDYPYREDGDTPSSQAREMGHLVYPWHRTGSLGNQGVPKADEPRYGGLTQKKMSNLRFSFNSLYYDLNDIWVPSHGISDAQVFNSEEQSLLKLKAPENSTLNSITYYGNVDKIVNISRAAGKEDGYFLYYAFGGYEWPASEVYRSEITALQNNSFNMTHRGLDPVHIKYKSGPHAVLALNYDSNGRQIILPTTNDSYTGQSWWPVNPITPSGGMAFWFETAGSGPGIVQDVLDTPSTGGNTHNIGYGYFWLAELHRDQVPNRFGGNSNDAIENNLWLPAGEPVSLLDSDNSPSIYVELKYTEGDTFYQRYDCLKTYPYTLEDINSVVDIVSFMCETRVNIDGRYDRNRGQKNNLTMRPQIFNLFNPVYNQSNNFFNFRSLNDDKLYPDKFDNLVTWSKSKTLGELVDTWANITLASTLDLDGDKGSLRALRRFNNEIYSFQDKGISRILFNSRVQINASDGVPIEIANSYKVDGKVYITQGVGVINKWSIASTPNGMYFIDNLGKSLYWFNGESIQSLSDGKGFRTFISEQNSLLSWDSLNFNNFITHYDQANKDLYFINKDYSLVYSETLGEFTSFYNYEEVPLMFNSGKKNFIFKNNNIWEQWGGNYNDFFGEVKPFYTTVVVNPDQNLDKVFNTLEYRADTYEDGVINHTKTFDRLDIWNEYQRGSSSLTQVFGKSSSLKKKFRIWRANIPRDNSNGRDRIRNTWAYLKLLMEDPGHSRTELHDLSVGYFI